MQTPTRSKTNERPQNHIKPLVRAPRPAVGLKIKTHVKAGLFPPGPY